MTRKFISTVLKAAGVAAVPLAMLAASVPAGAQRPNQRNPFEQRGNMSQEVLAQMQRVRAALTGVDQREALGYANPGEYQDWRYRNENYDKGHHKNKRKNKNYKNGYYRHGRGHSVYDHDRDRDDDGRYQSRYPNQYPSRYPSRGNVRYPSSQRIPGFPNPTAPNGRAGKTLPGTNSQYPGNNGGYRGH